MRARLILSFTVLLCLAAGAAGQEAPRDFRRALGDNPLLSTGNAALLATLPEGGFSEAAASFTKENGAIYPLEGSPDSWQAGAAAQSFYRISDKLAFCGSLSYSYFKGARMGGQVLIDPRGNPVNFLEEDLSTVGSKKREKYSLMGGISYNFNDRVAIGIKVDYTAEDQVKMKDPRFQDVRMKIGVVPGFMYRFQNGFTLGAGFIWQHGVDQLTAKTFGTGGRQYNILVDQGGFIGTREIFDGDAGYVSVSSTRYLASNGYGLGIQLGGGSSVRFAGEITGLWRTGYYGNKSSTTVVFCTFRGPEAGFKGTLDIPSGENNLHRIGLSASWKGLSKFTNSYSYKGEVGQQKTVEYQGKNKTLSGNDIEANLSYIVKIGTDGFLPSWEAGVRAGAFFRSQHTDVYPDYRDRRFVSLTASVFAAKGIALRSSFLAVKISGLYAGGAGASVVDGSYGGGTSKTISFDDWLYRQQEYDTASRAGASLEAEWTWLGGKKVSPFIRISDSFLYLLKKPAYLEGRYRNSAFISVGCNF